LPIVEIDDARQSEALFEALCEGGVPAAEITLRTPAGSLALERLITRHPDALLGAGTVRTLGEARRMIDIGVSFLVSPGTDEEVVAYGAAHDVLVLPGVITPSEVMRARKSGATLLKFFPAEAAGGVGMLKALAGPFGDVAFVPTGGIREGNLADYLRLATVVACGGSWLAPRDLINAGRFKEIRERTRRARAIVEEERGGRDASS
jgi:2-dehydro-3-deoxyphosphogluconate aldolase/(4S)-4-hydroxy-2-oxoglutarate aldolase